MKVELISLSRIDCFKIAFEKLEGWEIESDVPPDATESIAFWKGIWSEEVHYNENAEWLKEMERGPERKEK